MPVSATLDAQLPVTICGGETIGSVPVLPIDESTAWSADDEGRPVLALAVAAPGDFSLYTLTVRSSALDPYFDSALFTFKANCPSDFDCAPAADACEPPDDELVPIDYLAKDFASFKQALSDFSRLRYPLWVERSEADVGVMLMEVLSAVADELSYLQDRVAAEATIATATQRVSLVRHARLVDYEPSPPLAATTELQLNVGGGVTSVTSGLRCYALAPGGEQVPFEVGARLADPETGELVTVTYAVDERWNAGLSPYWWDSSRQCLPAGSTRLWLIGTGIGLAQGHALLVDTAGPTSADAPVREIVTLAAVEETTDPVFAVPLTRLDLAAPTTLEHDLGRTVLAGNLVPAVQGLRATETFAIPDPLVPPPVVDGPKPVVVRLASNWTCDDPRPDYRFTLAAPQISWFPLVEQEADLNASVPAVPELALQAATALGTPDPWRWDRWLLDAGPADDSFTLTEERYTAVGGANGKSWFEYDGQGVTIRFGDGVFGRVPLDGTVFAVTYLAGGGGVGNVAAGTIVHLDRGQAAAAGVVAVTNPFAAVGGADEETAQQIRDRAPQAFRAKPLRVVRPSDYVAAAQSLPWVLQAGTGFRWTGSWLTVFTTADPHDREDLTIAELEQLSDLLEPAPARRVRVVRPPAGVRVGRPEDHALRAPRRVPGRCRGRRARAAAAGSSRRRHARVLRPRALVLRSLARGECAARRRAGRDGGAGRHRRLLPRARSAAQLVAAAGDGDDPGRPDPPCRRRPEPAGARLAPRDRGGRPVTTGACRCESCCTELAVRNRPGLSTISYRVDEFSGFRRALLRPLEGEEALHGWHPTPGDLGLQVLEWWAYLGDVLTFYNERIANEDYLRTAELSASVSGLVALLGYTPRPAIAAAGKVAAIRSRSRPAEPLVVPAGMQLASSATPGVPSQTFEAAAATFTRATDGPIVLPPSPGLVSPPRPGESGFGSVLLRGSVAGVAAGDDVLIVPRDVETAKENWTELTVLSVSKESDPNGGSDTRVLLSTEYDWWAAYAQAADARLVKTTRSAQSWTPRGSGDPVLQLDGANLKIRLASIERALPLGEVAFLDFGADGLVPVVPTATQEEFLGVPYPGASGSPPSPPNIPLLHTVVTAETPYAAWLAAFSPAGLRFGLRDVGAPVGAPATTLASLPVTVGNPSGLAVAAGGAEAFVEDANGNGIAVLATTASDGAITLLAGDDTAATFLLAAPLRLDLAVVDVTRGATVAGEQLGTGDASVGGQTFALKKSPLTYLAQGAAWKSTLSVAVDSLYWTEVASFYAQPPDAKVFVVSQRPDGKSEVRFGDGTNGARLPTGGKVVATYRYGAGAASPPAGRLTTILKPQPNLASVHDPVAVWGGADAQQPEDVRTNAPASVLTFGRAISGRRLRGGGRARARRARVCAPTGRGTRGGSARSSRCMSATTRVPRRRRARPSRVRRTRTGRCCRPGDADRARRRVHDRGRPGSRSGRRSRRRDDVARRRVRAGAHGDRTPALHERARVGALGAGRRRRARAVRDRRRRRRLFRRAGRLRRSRRRLVLRPVVELRDRSDGECLTSTTATRRTTPTGSGT